MKNERKEQKVLIIIGASLILLGVLANQWVISGLFAPDGRIESGLFGAVILGLELALIALGALIIYFRGRRATKYVADLLVGTLFAVLCTLLLDRLLIVGGYPADYVGQVAHPANYVETFKNIEFTYEFRTNSQGIRNKETPLQKPESTERVVVIGDSFTEGVGVEGHETFVSLAEEMRSGPARAIEFLNCGLSGTGPLEQARILFHICMNYEPDAVLLILHANDVTETFPTSQPSDIEVISDKTGMAGVIHALWPRIYTVWETISIQSQQNSGQEDGGEMNMVGFVAGEARNRGISEAEIAAWEKKLPSELVAATNRQEFNGYILAAGLLQPTYWSDTLEIAGEDAEVRYQAMISLLNETIARCRARGVPVGAVFAPTPFQYDPNYGDVWRTVGVHTKSSWAVEPTELEQRLDAWATEQELPYLDLTPHYRTLVNGSPQPDLYYPIDGHWTAKGHQVAAEQIVQWLESRSDDFSRPGLDD
ncbi:MAG: hypothetical protein ACPGWR_29350 [Ardenticatenaceae bacterium]